MGNCSSADVVHSDAFTALPAFKIALVGDSQTGKTAIFNRFVKNYYFKSYIPTKRVEIVNVIKKVNIPEHAIVSLTLWDTPGRDDIDLSQTYFSHIDAAVVVVDVTSNESMEMAGYWKQQVINTVTNQSDMSTSEALKLPILLLGNKFDLVDKERPIHDAADAEVIKDLSGEKFEYSDELMISTEEEELWKPECVHKIEHLVEQHGFISGVMVSAKDPEGSIHQAMQSLIRKLMEKSLQEKYGEDYKRRGKKKKNNSKMAAPVIDTSLTLTGVESIDVHVKGCEIPVKRISELKSAYEKSLHNLKLACADAELIPVEHYTKVTLEQCVTALKLELGENLMAEEMECGMVTLMLNTKDRPKEEILACQRKFNNGLKAYSEFAEVCAIILSETELLESSLRKFDSKILKSQSEVWEKQRGQLATEDVNGRGENEKSQVDFKFVSSVIDTNRVQIAESLLWIEELYKHAERARDRVSTALMW